MVVRYTLQPARNQFEFVRRQRLRKGEFIVMSIFQVIVLAIVQGFAELLPVSSSAHVVVAEKLLGLNPSSPEMTLLLVMLHSGTMFAVIAYFWRQWRQIFFRDGRAFKRFAFLAIIATLLTGVVGEGLVLLIENTLFRHHQKAEVEQLFSHLEFIAPALFFVGVLIVIAGLKTRAGKGPEQELGAKEASLVGIVQGLAIPFRGFSRSGATISSAMLAGVEKRKAEAFSFALAVAVTPPVVVREAHRFIAAQRVSAVGSFASGIWMSILGMVCAFVAGLLALTWLSNWLESGRWHIFGVYCMAAAVIVFSLWRAGY